MICAEGAAGRLARPAMAGRNRYPEEPHLEPGRALRRMRARSHKTVGASKIVFGNMPYLNGRLLVRYFRPLASTECPLGVSLGLRQCPTHVRVTAAGGPPHIIPAEAPGMNIPRAGAQIRSVCCGIGNALQRRRGQRV
jgi:hypothetical protein